VYAVCGVLQLPNAKVAEHLSQSLQDSSSVQETLSSLQGEIPQGRVHEFEIELERLQVTGFPSVLSSASIRETLKFPNEHMGSDTVVFCQYGDQSSGEMLNFSQMASGSSWVLHRAY
jgi:hypothetical protein